MAGYPWEFTLLPETINEITVTQTGTSNSVVLQRQSITPVDSGFATSHFVETNTVIISATGYQDVENVLVGTSSITMTPASSKPEHLYAWNKMGSVLSGDKFVYTASSTPSVGDLVYNSNGELTDYTVQHIVNSNAITIEECLVIFKVTPSNVNVDVVVNGETFHDLILSIPYGSTATYTVYGEGYKAKTGTITTTIPYQVFEISLEEPNKSYTITYDDTDYTSTTVSEGHGLVINTIRADKTEVDLGNDFTIVEN